MVDEHSLIEFKEWEAAREIWGKAGKDVPESPDKSSLHFLADLQRVVVNFEMSKSVSERDRDSDLSFEDLADRCRDLNYTFSEIDEIAFARLAGASPVRVDQTLAETTANLSILEAALRHTKTPRIPRKKKHEHSYYLIAFLADIYEPTTGRKASVTKDPITDERKGSFIDFAMCFAKHFLPEQSSILNARAIERGLETRRRNPDPLWKA
jgi:hypothetical protein